MPSRSKPRTKPRTKPRRAPSRQTSAQRMDAIALLKQDHARVKKLLTQLAATKESAGSRRHELFKLIENELKVHTRLEEEIFYPAFKEAANRTDQHIYYEAVEEHHMVDIALPQMKATKVESEEFGAKAKVLKDLVLHHAEEEEEAQMFVKARSLMSAAELQDLGRKIQTRKQVLQSSMLTRVARTTGSALGRIMNGGKKRAA